MIKGVQPKLKTEDTRQHETKQKNTLNQAKEYRESDTEADVVRITSESMESALQEKPKIPPIPDINVPMVPSVPEGQVSAMLERSRR